MQLASMEHHGWSLVDAEEISRNSPKTFVIPDRDVRRVLEAGDFAKLIFRIAVEGETETAERMWVVVRDRTPSGYLGILDNEPATICENDDFWRGSEFFFEARHIIEVAHANAESILLAKGASAMPWIAPQTDGTPRWPSFRRRIVGPQVSAVRASPKSQTLALYVIVGAVLTEAAGWLSLVALWWFNSVQIDTAFGRLGIAVLLAIAGTMAGVVVWFARSMVRRE